MNETSPNGRVTLEGIHWREVFPFTHLFRSFRLAIHPSKLVFALAAVLACYMGGRFLDLLTGKQVVVEQPLSSLRYPADEIQKYISSPTMVEFYRWRSQAQDKNEQQLAAAVAEYLKESPRNQERIRSEDAINNLRSTLSKEQRAAAEILAARYAETSKLIAAEHAQARKSAKDKAGVEKIYHQRKEQLDQAAGYLRLAVWNSSLVAGEAIQMAPAQALATVLLADPQAKDAGKAMEKLTRDREQITRTVALADAYRQVKTLEGLGIFQAALSYGILMFNSAVDSVLNLEPVRNPKFVDFTTTPKEAPGLLRTLTLSFQGLAWFARVHWLYFAVYGLFSLLVWSVAGGAICRIAALHATRDEKIPSGEALSFAVKKFASFFAAPLMPVLFVLGCCLPLVILGVVGMIPWVGELIVGLGFFAVLLISFALAITVVGGVGGLGLMYPTIAVEGSDTFDAFSRSYSYVYARPWRTLFYILMAAIYGTLCFVFVKVLVWLVFYSAATFVGWPMNALSASYAAPLGKLQAMWFSPTLSGPFFGRFFLFKLNWSEAVGSLFVAIWVFTLVGLVIAFAVSFFFCASTIIYLLLRRSVDATELDEVYVEEVESQLGLPPTEAVATEPAGGASPGDSASAPPAGSAEPGSSSPEQNSPSP